MDLLSILALIVVGISTAVVAVAVWWVFGPLHRAAEERDRRVQFTLADVLCLFVLMQLTLGVVHWTAGDATIGDLIAADVVCFFCVAFAWWTCVRMLSRAGVRVVWQRCVVLLAVLPITGIGGFAIAASPFAAINLFAGQRDRLHDVSAIVGAILSAGVLYVLGCFMRGIVALAGKE
jgi:hypothetical protein